jgi:squalene synthase HpnC
MHAVSVDHYENFPVASLLCPPHLRPAVSAIYWFARTADDLADEGADAPQQRLADLHQYRGQLGDALGGLPTSGRWSSVFAPLAEQARRHALPAALLHDLLDAFEQDVVKHDYADNTELLDYCRRSANPIGRLLLHLYGIRDEQAQRQSDAICTALQLANFWQDLSVDLPRGRRYVPASECARHGLTASTLLERIETPGRDELLCDLVAWTRALMHAGADLVHRVPGRAGWELRLVVQGGLRILDKVEQMGCATLSSRPTLRWFDAPLIAWRAVCMRSHPAPLASKAT